MSDLIQYKDGVTIEVAAPQDRTVPVKGSAVEKVQASFDSVVSALRPVFEPLSQLFKTTTDALEEAEVTVGVGFTAEGGIFVTKATAEANLEVKLTFRKKREK